MVLQGTQSQPLSNRQRVERLLGEVGALKQEVQQIEDGYQDSHRVGQSAGRNIESSQWPLRRAQSDTAQTNVSNEGRQAQHYLGQASRSLRDNDFRLTRLEGDSRETAQSFQEVKSELQSLINDLPGFNSNLQQAQVYLNGASDDHRDANGQAGWGLNRQRGAERELQWAEMNVNNVAWDRPGTNVSGDARQASMRVDQAQWQMRDSDSNLFQAQAYEDRSGRNLTQVEDQLKQALTQLTSTN